MKTFKVNIPQDQMDFMLKLFDSLKFTYHEIAETEERTYFAKDYMIEKGLIPKEKIQTSDSDQTKHNNKFAELRNAIDRIQNARSEHSITQTFAFRLPTTGSETAKIRFTSHQELKNYLETYFRVSIDHISFKAFKGKGLQQDDNFEVIIHVKDVDSKITTIKAGYSNTSID